MLIFLFAISDHISHFYKCVSNHFQGPKLSSCGQRRLLSDWADAQADLSLRWAHTHFAGFVMSRLKCVSNHFQAFSSYFAVEIHIFSISIKTLRFQSLSLSFRLT